MLSVGDLIYSHRLQRILRINEIQSEYTILDGEESSVLYLKGEDDDSGEEFAVLPSNVEKIDSGP